MSQARKCLTVLTACLFAFALPAVAQAAPNWVRVADPAPGGTVEWEDGYPKIDLAVADGTPYLAAQERPAVGHDLQVWRPNHAGTQWIQVGGTLNHAAPPQHSAGPVIAADGATPWVAWLEGPDGAPQVRVARLDGAAWKEPVAASQTANWPQASGFGSLRLVVFGGRPYVTVGTGDVARLNAAGIAVEHVTAGLPSGCVPSLTVSGGRLYTPCAKELMRLNSAGTAWQHVVTNADPFSLVDVTGTLYLLKDPCCSANQGEIFKLTPTDQLEEVFQGDAQFDRLFAGFKGSLWAARSGDTPGPDALGPATLRALTSGRWWPAPSPSLPQEGAAVVKFFEDGDGALWLLWHAYDPFNSVGPPRTVHVARFVEQGTPFRFAADPVTAPPGGPPEPPPPPPPGDDDGGFTDPGGDPIPPADSGEPPLLPGACKNVLSGTGRADRLVGSRFGDRILGRAGNDELFGRGGSDCIWGGPGNDVVSGGDGPDALAGDSGNDRMVPGDGRDDVSAGAGNDTIEAAGGGVDRINCGAGRDVVRLSRNDLIKGCEKVRVIPR